MTASENPKSSALEHRIRELVKNYETRAAHSPEPRAQWADVAQDLRTALLEAVADEVDEDRRLGRGIFVPARMAPGTIPQPPRLA